MSQAAAALSELVDFALANVQTSGDREKVMRYAALTKEAIEPAPPKVRARPWPYVETPGEFAGRLQVALNDFNGDMVAAVRHVLIEKPPAVARTPSADWRVLGDEDPHGRHYHCERAQLALGHFTDDELANGAFLNYNMPLNVEAILQRKPGYYSPIMWMTGVKDRIRWLSRRLEEATTPLTSAQVHEKFEAWWATTPTQDNVVGFDLKGLSQAAYVAGAAKEPRP